MLMRHPWVSFETLDLTFRRTELEARSGGIYFFQIGRNRKPPRSSALPNRKPPSQELIHRRLRRRASPWPSSMPSSPMRVGTGETAARAKASITESPPRARSPWAQRPPASAERRRRPPPRPRGAPCPSPPSPPISSRCFPSLLDPSLIARSN